MAALDTDLIAFVDADDLWLPEKMARQIAYLEAHPEIAMVACLFRLFHHSIGDDGTGAIRPGLTRTGIVIRRDLARTIGPVIDPPGNRGDMIDWIARAREAGFRDHLLDEVLALRRILPGSLSWGRDKAKDLGYLKVAHDAMRRRKAQTE
jgi:hypothetical protein